MAFFPTDLHAFGNRPAEGPIVRCPGCGTPVALGPTETDIASCESCTTRLISFGRRLDVEGSVRERLYGDAQRGTEAAVRRGRFCRAALGSWFPRTTGLRVE
jgi:hypothetical protein